MPRCFHSRSHSIGAQKLWRGFRRDAVTYALAVAFGLASAHKIYAQAPQPSTSQDQQAPAQQQTPQSSTAAPSTQQTPAAPAAPAPPAAHRAQLPQILVNAPKQKPKTVQRRTPQAPTTAAATINPTTAAERALDAKMTGLDQARDQNLLPKLGASTYTITRETIENLPQADNTPIDKVILQMPGVSYDFGRFQSQLPRARRIRQRPDQDQRRRRPGGRFRILARSSTPISSAACRF